MSDLQLDSTGDLLISDFSFQLTFDDTEAVKQRLQIRLKAFVGEYFLDTDFGTPYYQQVFVKGISQGVIDSVFKDVIIKTTGVARISSYISNLNRTTRAYSADWKAVLNSSEEIEGTI